jgi:NAD(P)-dependent dehydrogenase (short-subunit alcohol dehydrogenase family)
MDKVLAITGGASGIGLAIARAAAAEDWRLVLADRDEKALDAVRDELGASTTALDVTDEAAVEAWITGAARLGRLAGCVTAAGIAADVPVLDHPTELFRRILDVNVTGTFLAARAAARVMVESGGGAIVTLASISGLRGSKGRAAYGASKAAVINLTQVMAVDLGRCGVRCNAICPGPVETPLVQRLHGPEERGHWQRYLPLGRYAQPAEIAGMALFLLDEAKASYITGQAIAVDGGYAGAGVMPVGTN